MQDFVKGTAYQTDLGMCGDYDSLWIKKKNFLKKILKIKTNESNFPAFKISIVAIVNANNKTV